MRRSIAQKKALEAGAVQSRKPSNEDAPRNRNKRKTIRPLALLGACTPLGALAYFCKFVLPGYSFTALVCIGIICVILFYGLMPYVGRVLPRFAKVSTTVFTTALILGLTLFAITEYAIIRSSTGTEEPTSPYLVVLGAKVRANGPSTSLWDRIYAAADFLNAHPDTIAIVSGGQGNDEPISEAQSMYDELVKLGISPERIWMEDKATSTDENMRFSLNLIETRIGSRPDTLAVLSSEYHLHRASLMAKKLGIEFEGVPARTSMVSQLVNHAMREVAGVWHFYIFGR